MAGITKQMAIPYFFIKYSALFQLPQDLYIEGKNNPKLDFLPSTYYIYSKGTKSTE